jgi:L-threonylcarbamoyladenylate synthase
MDKLIVDENDCVAVVDKCVEALNVQGAVLLIPTETVYGLVCRFDDMNARQRIYSMKGRERNKPFQIFVSKCSRLLKLPLSLNEAATKITHAFCPGPVTVVVANRDGVTKTGYRIPDHFFVSALLNKLDFPLAATSANRSGQPDALSVCGALEDIEGMPDLAVDGGVLPENAMPSTVVEVFPDNSFEILRPGPVTEKMIREVLKKT